MLILSENQIRSIYKMKDAIDDIENALIARMEGKINSPHRTVLDFPSKKASALYMPSAMETIGKSAVKVVTIFPGNPAQGLRTTQGVILLSDSTNGEHVACMNASYLTRLRTGALSGIATKHLANKEASTLAVIGCGAMAEEQLQAVCAVRDITKINLYNRTKEKAKSFANKINELIPNFQGDLTITRNPNEAVKDANIVNCSTRSETPVFSGEVLNPGTHINGVGSYLPHMQEVDLVTLQRASKIVADTVEGVKEEAGDFIIPSKAGDWNFNLLHGELTDLAGENIHGRENEEEITFFKSVGAAYFDLAAAAAVYEKAIQLKIGSLVEV